MYNMCEVKKLKPMYLIFLSNPPDNGPLGRNLWWVILN